MLILAGVAINLTIGDNGIFTRAKDATITTAIASVKEEIELESGAKLIDNEKLTPEIMLSEGKAKRTVQQGEDGNYYMYYALKEGAYKGMQNLGKGNITDLKDVFLIDDNLNLKYIASDGKEYGDNINNKILQDETEIKFVSKEFEEYIKKASGVADGKLRFKWMKNLTNLSIEDLTITSLEDLVFFPNLNTIILQNCNSLESINGIEKCQKLTQLNLVSCYEINNLDALKNIKTLEHLQITNANAIDINGLVKALENTNIETLELQNVGIEDVSAIKELANLKKLNLSYNKIKNIDFVSNLKNLTYLDLRGNNITDFLCLSELDNLTELYLKGNDNIDGNRANYNQQDLDKLNKIGKILEKGGKIILDVDKLGLFNNYKSLDLSNENLTNINFLENMTELENLELQNNNLTFESEEDRNILKQMTNLKSLNISFNYINDISFLNDLTNLKTLNIDGDNNSKIDLKQIEDLISNVSLSVTNEQLQTLNNCDSNKILKITLINSSNVKSLPDLSNFNNLESINIVNSPLIDNWNNILGVKNLKTLNISYCNLNNKMMDFSKLNNIETIYLRNNYISSTDLQKLSNLNGKTLDLDLSNNSIIDANILLNLNASSKIYLTGNANLSQDSKTQLTEHFGNNVYF